MKDIDVLLSLDDLIGKAESDGKDASLLKAFHASIYLSMQFQEELEVISNLFNREKNNDAAGRMLVRTLSAEFEAKLYLLQQLLLHVSLNKDHAPTLHEIAILNGESVYIKNNGAIGVSKKFYPFLDNLIFTLRLAQRSFGEHVYCDTAVAGWKDVKIFIDVRNRITHPKLSDDLHITDQEVDSLNRAQDWLRLAFGSVFSGYPTEA